MQLAFGGNKTRKLEYLVPDALEKGATHLVSIGGVQSNHTRQVAALAAKLGLRRGWSRRALIDLVRTGEIGADSTVLYAHFGGQPALNAYGALFRS
jgi:1-aminocyclopropane-1-carboxylate deaminase/D-cysteine desulfhydrase-like pyridoxal-dependent ACC family enzyme